jgi:L-ascorbate metabolism protein UlaG (beta-lactamase superfamily)
MKKLLEWVGKAALWLVIAAALAATIVPLFLDRIYYSGPAQANFDGAHFSNPDGEINFPVPKGAPKGNLLTRLIMSRVDRPEWPKQVAVTPSRPAMRLSGNTMRATWVGHATVLVQAGSLNILTDPIWSDWATPFPGVGPRRVAQPGVRFEDLPRIDIVVVSHDHYDHMDIPTLQKLWERDRPLIVTSLGNDTILRQAGIPSRALNWDGAVAGPQGATVHVVRNHHWSSRWGKDRNRALWSAFFIATKAGNVFFSGDTGAGDMGWTDDTAKLGPIRLAMIPIGAFRFYPGQMANDAHIGPGQAVEVFEHLRASTAIPVHWGTFHLSSEAYDTPPKMLKLFTGCAGIDAARFAPLRIGEQIEVPPYAPVMKVKADAAPCAEGSPALAALK